MFTAHVVNKPGSYSQPVTAVVLRVSNARSGLLQTPRREWIPFRQGLLQQAKSLVPELDPLRGDPRCPSAACNPA